ncbi:hypothetical protein FVR03_23480 [Pontibacter qinzhouensis]|uniref:Uncharacterized protein n=1 Tax=Pontibacter qinzhouensis TaxID=2603253 RepID=A0A5C8IIW9_9BACT|nr:hypothetical protein [Pontibacter qinzhouensis]TXK21247.1 hypothetical protein FVR03_23480 [Pontibacter qinzhouensis]
MQLKKGTLFLIALLSFFVNPTESLAQIIKGLSFGKNYTAERIAEIYYDKDIDIEVLYNTWYRIKVPLSEIKYHYLLIELVDYTEQNGGKLNRVLLSKVPLEETDKLFSKSLSLYGQPSNGWEEISDFIHPSGRRIVDYSKVLIYEDKFTKGDGIVVQIHARDMDGLHSFEIQYHKSIESINLPTPYGGNRWKVYKKHGRTITVH